MRSPIRLGRLIPEHDNGGTTSGETQTASAAGCSFGALALFPTCAPMYQLATIQHMRLCTSLRPNWYASAHLPSILLLRLSIAKGSWEGGTS